MTYQTATGLRAFMFSLGVVFASTPEEAHQFASRHGLWDRRADGTWGRDATQAHEQLCKDQQTAYRSLADRQRRAMIETGQPQAGLALAQDASERTRTTAELQDEFEVLSFAAPFVVVRRRSDGVLGSLEFTHSPRVYFGWKEHEA
jgi:hypothetical protein